MSITKFMFEYRYIKRSSQKHDKTQSKILIVINCKITGKAPKNVS